MPSRLAPSTPALKPVRATTSWVTPPPSTAPPNRLRLPKSSPSSPPRERATSPAPSSPPTAVERPSDDHRSQSPELQQARLQGFHRRYCPDRRSTRLRVALDQRPCAYPHQPPGTVRKCAGVSHHAQLSRREHQPYSAPATNPAPSPPPS